MKLSTALAITAVMFASSASAAAADPDDLPFNARASAFDPDDLQTLKDTNQPKTTYHIWLYFQ